MIVRPICSIWNNIQIVPIITDLDFYVQFVKVESYPNAIGLSRKTSWANLYLPPVVWFICQPQRICLYIHQVAQPLTANSRRRHLYNIHAISGHIDLRFVYPSPAVSGDQWVSTVVMAWIGHSSTESFQHSQISSQSQNNSEPTEESESCPISLTAS